MFDRDADFIGIAIGEGCNTLTIRAHLQEMLQWARAYRTSVSFYVQVGKFKAKERLLNEINEALDIGLSRHVGRDQLWKFLCRFVVLSFDFDSSGSRDSTDCWDALRSVVRYRSPKQAKVLFDGLYGLVSRYSQSSGEIDYETMRDELQEHVPLWSMPSLSTIRVSLVRQVSNQLLKEKKSRKYIPDVFTAIDSIKDAARYFSHPCHFATKPVEEFRAIDTSFLNRLHAMLRISPFSLKLPNGFKAPSRLGQVYARCSKLRAHFENLSKDLLDDYYKENWDNLRRRLPADTQYIFDDAKYVVRNPGCCVRRAIEKLVADLSLMKARVFLLTSRAGQGKTNFVCDFAENFLLLHRIPCLLLTGRELRAVPTDGLVAHLAQIICGDDAAISLIDALAAVGSVCDEANAPFVVIFDGINEHPDIGHFADALEKVIERLLSFSFVKVIVTCRSEYFSERFSNLRTATFSDSIHEVQEIQREMPELHRHRMRMAYFRFFRLQPSYMSSTVCQTLERDPLLLRFFCEAYGDPDVRDPVTLPAMPDVYREAVFRKYLAKKLNEVASRHSPGPGAGVPVTRPYKDVLRAIIGFMVGRSQFVDIPLSAVDTSLQDALAELIAEDVFVRRDLVAGRSVLDADAEVINFTFDEFRDYLLADHLLNVVREDEGEEAFTRKLRQFTDDKCPIVEGITRFMFYEAKKPGCEELLASIASMPWYDTVFLQCIFSVEECCVTDSDIQIITTEFSGNPAKAQSIFFALMHRWDTVALPRLNIDVLFRILDGLSDEAFNDLVQPVFYDPMQQYAYHASVPYEIERFSSDIRSLVIKPSSSWDTHYTKLVELLIYLFAIEGPAYDFPAYALFSDLAAQRPKEAVDMLSSHIDVGLMSVRGRVWEMLADIAARGFEMPVWLVDRAMERLRKSNKGSIYATNSMRRFLIACRGTLGMELNDDLMTAAAPLTFFDILEKNDSPN